MKKIKYTASVLALSIALIGGANATEAQTFKDVPTHVQYYEAVEKLAELGIITKAEKFNPQNTLTRGQMAKIMALSLNLDTKNVKDPKFKDVPTTHQFYPYIAALVNAGVVSGYPDGTYGVGKNVTRAHMAKFIVNGFGFKNRELERYFLFDINEGTEVHKNVSTLHFYQIEESEEYRPNEGLLRLEAAEMITKAMHMKSLKEVVIPLESIIQGEGAGAINFKEDLLIAEADPLNNELVLIPLQQGKIGVVVTTGNGDGKHLQVDIDANLNITYELTNEFDLAYKGLGRLQLWANSESGSPVRRAYMEQLTGNERETYDLEHSANTVDVSSNKIGESFKVTAEFEDGEVQESFVYVEEEEWEVFTKQFNVGTANVVTPELYASQYTISEKDADVIKLVTEDEDGISNSYFEISKVGNYRLENKSEPGRFVTVEVVEFEGKLMARVIYNID